MLPCYCILPGNLKGEFFGNAELIAPAVVATDLGFNISPIDALPITRSTALTGFVITAAPEPGATLILLLRFITASTASS